MTRCLILAALALTAAPAAALPPPPQRTLRSAVDVLGELRGIPAHVLRDAQGVAIIPRVIRAGFIFGGRGGHGLVIARDRNGAWGEPTFINLGGASFGLQAGVQSTDVVLVFRTRRSLDRLMSGRGQLTLGADASVAAGPVGRDAEAATDARLQAEIVSFSRSRGLFAGVALGGAVLTVDRRADEMFRDDTRPETRYLADELRLKLTEMTHPRAVAPLLPLPPATLPPAEVPTRP